MKKKTLVILLYITYFDMDSGWIIEVTNDKIEKEDWSKLEGTTWYCEFQDPIARISHTTVKIEEFDPLNKNINIKISLHSPLYEKTYDGTITTMESASRTDHYLRHEGVGKISYLFRDFDINGRTIYKFVISGIDGVNYLESDYEEFREFKLK